MISSLLALAATILQPDPQAVPTNSEAETPEIVVEGERPETESEVLGSRIGRARQEVGNGQIRTATGVAGLAPGSGMDPFAGRTRRRIETECRSEARITQNTACDFAEVQDAFEAQDFGRARAGIDRILLRKILTDDERFLAHRVAFVLALADGDSIDRKEALQGMLASRAMPADQRAPALRALAAIALDEGDSEQAMRLFERAVAADPRDAKARGNLAALYSNVGRDEEALRLIREAIVLARSAGEIVPPHWLEYAESR